MNNPFNIHKKHQMGVFPLPFFFLQKQDSIGRKTKKSVTRSDKIVFKNKFYKKISNVI